MTTRGEGEGGGPGSEGVRGGPGGAHGSAVPPAARNSHLPFRRHAGVASLPSRAPPSRGLSRRRHTCLFGKRAPQARRITRGMKTAFCATRKPLSDEGAWCRAPLSPGRTAVTGGFDDAHRVGPSWTREVRALGAGAQHARVLEAAACRAVLQPGAGGLGAGARRLEAASLARRVTNPLAASVLDPAHGAHPSRPSKLGHFRAVTATNAAGSQLPGRVGRSPGPVPARPARGVGAACSAEVAGSLPSRRGKRAAWPARSAACE